jgi:hypothetical protein
MLKGAFGVVGWVNVNALYLSRVVRDCFKSTLISASATSFLAEKAQKTGKIAHFVLPDQGERLRKSTFKTLSKGFSNP